MWKVIEDLKACIESYMPCFIVIAGTILDRLSLYSKEKYDLIEI